MSLADILRQPQEEDPFTWAERQYSEPNQPAPLLYQLYHKLRGTESPRWSLQDYAQGIGTSGGSLSLKSPELTGPLMQAKQRLPMRVWDFLTKHPQEVKVMIDPTTSKPGYNAGLKRIRVNPEYPDKPMALAHELGHAAQDLRGKVEEAAPGFWLSDQGILDLIKQGYKNPGQEFFPLHMGAPRSFKDQLEILPQNALHTLENWWTRPVPLYGPSGGINPSHPQALSELLDLMAP